MIQPLPKFKKYEKKISFSGKACWIDGIGCKEGEWIAVEVPFTASGETVLLLSAGDSAEVYINGTLYHRFVTRSYIYDKAYEALDITEFLKPGENMVRFVFRHVESREFRGLLFEITDGIHTIVSDTAKKAMRLPRLLPGCNGDIHHSGLESYDESKESTGEDIGLETFGTAAHCIPFEKLHQTTLPVQARYISYPEKVIEAERYTEPSDFIKKIYGRPDGCGKAIYFTTVTCDEDTMFACYFLRTSDKLVLDGKEAVPSGRYPLSRGKHTVAILGTDLQIQITCPKSRLSEWRLLPLSVPAVPPVCYPWNDCRVIPPLSEEEEKLCYTTDYGKLSTLPVLLDEVQFNQKYRTYEYYTSDDSVTEPQNQNWKPRKKIEKAGIEIDGTRVTVHPSPLSCAVSFDFGVEQVGYAMIHISSKAAVNADILGYEVLSVEGDIYDNEFSETRYQTVPGDNHYVSVCRRGFKFLKIFLPPADEDIILEVACENYHCPVPMEKQFESDDRRLDQVYQICLDTARVCTLDYYVDCPGFEQNIWTGDATITSLVNLWCFGRYDTNAEYLKLIGESMSDKLTEYYRTGNSRYIARRFLPCGCFPTYPDRNIAVWSYQWLLAVFFHYRSTGDLDLVRELLPVIEETLKRSEDWFSPRGLFAMEGTWNLVEWGNNDITEYGECLCNSMMLTECFRRSADLEEAMGKAEAAADYRRKAEKLKEAINRYGWDSGLDMYADTIRDETAYGYYKTYCEHTLSEPLKRQRYPMSYDKFRLCRRVSVQTATFAILYGIAEGDRLEKCKKILCDNIRSGEYVAGTPSSRSIGKPTEAEAPGGIVRIGSPFFLYFALDALYSVGEVELCEKAMRRDWGEMLDLGLRNCTEVFNKKGEITTRSIAHAWSASPAYFMSRYTLGVLPLEPGFKTFTVCPKSVVLNHASGKVRTPYGDIEVSWTRNGEKADISCKYPKELTYVK